MIRSTLGLVAAAAIVASASLGACGSGDCAATPPTTCPKAEPSYSADVEPLISKYCLKCHAPGGEESDIPLTSYAAVKGRSDDMPEQLKGCDMPPSSETQPTEVERNTLLSWLLCGAKNN